MGGGVRWGGKTELSINIFDVINPPPPPPPLPPHSLKPGVPIVLTQLRVEAPVPAPANTPSARPLFLVCSEYTGCFLGTPAPAAAEQPAALLAMASWVPEVANVLATREQAISDGEWWGVGPGGMALTAPLEAEQVPSVPSTLCRPATLVDYQRVFFPRNEEAPLGEETVLPPRLSPRQLARLAGGAAAFVRDATASAAAAGGWAPAAAAAAAVVGGGGKAGGKKAGAAAAAAAAKHTALLGEPLPPIVVAGTTDVMAQDDEDGDGAAALPPVLSIAALAARHLPLQQFQHVRIILMGKLVRVDQAAFRPLPAGSEGGGGGGDAAPAPPAAAAEPSQRKSKKAIKLARGRALQKLIATAKVADRLRGKSLPATASAAGGKGASKASTSSSTAAANKQQQTKQPPTGAASRSRSVEPAARPSKPSRTKRGEVAVLLQSSWLGDKRDTRQSGTAARRPMPTRRPLPPAKASSSAAAAASSSKEESEEEGGEGSEGEEEGEDAPPVRQQLQRKGKAGGKAPSAKSAPTAAPAPAAAPSPPAAAGAAAVVAAAPASSDMRDGRYLVENLHEEWCGPGDDDGRANADAPLTVLTVSDLNDHSSVILLPLRTSSLLPHIPSLPPSVAPTPPGGPAAQHPAQKGKKGAAAAAAEADGPSLDPELDALRSFFPASAPRERGAFIQYVLNRRCAFGVSVHQRTADNFVDAATGKWMSEATIAALPPAEAASRRGTRLATLRVEAIYDLEEGEEGTEVDEAVWA